ncbi:hypothetical protein [[Mycoplasma] testudinis]|uniref:hypothetical protein n=1 Tax=[Mycoplasma] testudinis TaxID=33924 RepID=UPI0012EB332A|nr:hypothetical protein [[Mycoplasma] testudinis]
MRWFYLLLLGVNLFVVIFVFGLAILSAVENNNAAFLWFKNLDNWTQETNLLVVCTPIPGQN